MTETKMTSRRETAKTRRRLTKANINVSAGDEDMNVQDNGEKRYYVSHVDTDKKDRLLTGEHLRAMTRDICQQSGMVLERTQPKSTQEAILLLENLGFIVLDLLDSDKHNRVKVETLTQALRSDPITLAELELLRVHWGNCIPVINADKKVVSILNPDEDTILDKDLIPVNITPGGRFEPEYVACPEAYLVAADAKKAFGADLKRIELKFKQAKEIKKIKINRLPPEV